MSRLRIVSAALAVLVAAAAQAQIIVPSMNTPVTITFTATQNGIFQVGAPGANVRGVIEPEWWARYWGDIDRGLHTETFVIRHSSFNEYGLGTGVAGYFVDGNNDGDVYDQFGGNGVILTLQGEVPNNVSNMVRLAGNDDWASSDVFIRIRNMTGQTVPQWNISFDLYGHENDDNYRSTVYGEYVVSNSLQPGALTYTTLSTTVIPNTGGAFQLVANISNTFAASVANGDYLVFRLREVPPAPPWGGQGPGSGVYFDNFSVAAIPEPGSVGLILGAAAILIVRRRLNRG